MKKWIPLLIIVALMLTAYFTELTKYLSFVEIKERREGLMSWLAHYPVLMPLAFIGIYIITITLSLPGGALLSVVGGFLFGVPLGTIYVLAGATIGATLIFLATRTALGDLLKKRAGPFLSKIKRGFDQNPASHLLFLRLVPLFPFWLINLAPAFFNVRTRTYVWTTFVGIIPGAYVFTQTGKGLGAIFDSGSSFSFDTVFNMEMKIALVVITLFALLSIFIKRLRRDR